MNEKIKMVVDLCTPTAERRPTTIEDIYDDFKVLEFNSKKELANELARMSGYKNLKEFKQELVDEGDDLDDYDFEGDALDKICQYFLSAMSDPSDGSPNIQYISINGKPVYEDYWMTYDTLSDNMDLLAHGSEEDIIKYYLKYEYDYIEDEDDSEDDKEYKESFKSKVNMKEDNSLKFTSMMKMKIALMFNHFADDYSIIVTGIDDETSLEPFVGEDDYIVTTDWNGKSLIVFSRNDEDGYIEQLKGVYTKEGLEKYSKNIIKKEIQNQLKYLTEKDGLIEDVDFASTLITVDLYDAPNRSPEEVWDLIQDKDLDKLTDIAYELCVNWIEGTYIDGDSSSVYGYLDLNKNEIVLGGDHNFFIYTLNEYLEERGDEDDDLDESLKWNRYSI